MKEGWTYKKLDEVGVTQTGTTPSKTNSANYGDFIPFIRPAEIPVDGSGKINYNTEIRLSEEGVKNGRLFKTNSVLMVCIGSIGKLGYLEQDASCNQQINVLTPNAEYDSKYVFYAMSTPAFQKESLKIAQGAQATLPIINKSKWSNLLIPIPPTIDEQHFIVSRLDAAFANIDALKANAERQLAEARKLFQAELTECMRPKEGWEKDALIEVFNFIDYRGATPNKIQNGVPLVTAKNVKYGYLDYTIKDFISREEYETRKSRGISKKGDILFTTEAPLGNVAIADLDEFSAGQRLITLQQYKKPKYTVVNEFCYYYMLSSFFQNRIKELATGATAQGIKAKLLKTVIVPIPPIEVQHQIVARLDALSAHVRQLEEVQRKTLAECDALKQAMLREVFE